MPAREASSRSLSSSARRTDSSAPRGRRPSGRRRAVEHLIGRNEIHHVSLDTGGVGTGSMGVYLDDCVSGETVFGNVFYKVPRAAFIGDGRGLDRSPVWRDMVEKTMKERLEAMHHREPPYRERYPELAKLDAHYANGQGVPPEGNLVARDVSFGGTWTKTFWHAKPEMVEIHDNLVGKDPRCVDPAKMNFALRDDSRAFKIGFEPIPFEKIGLVRGEERAEAGDCPPSGEALRTAPPR